MHNYATMFYKVKFSIAPVKPEDDLLWKIVMHIKNWQTRKCRKRHVTLPSDPQEWTHLKWGGKLNAEDNSVWFESVFFAPEDSDAQYWACRVQENFRHEPRYANQQWITELGYEQDHANHAVLSCVVSYSDRAGFIGPYMDVPTPSIPNLILNIVDDQSIHSFCGPDELLRVPQKLKAGEWPDFFQRIIDENRKFPYIFISPQIINYETQETRCLVNPDVLAEKILGNALVFYADNPEFSREMSYMNADYACFGGGIRVYQPDRQDPTRHRYLSANDIQTFGGEQVIDYLLRAFSQNVHFYDSFFCLEECKRKKEAAIREQRREKLLTDHRAGLTQMENEHLQELIEEEDKRLKVEADLADMQEQLEAEKAKTFNLEAQVEQFRSAAEENSGLRRAQDARLEIAALPDSVEKVMDYFNCTFADRIAFSEDARKSAKKCRLELDELWKVFFALSNTMCDLYRKANGDIFAEFRRATQIDAVRGEGTMTRKDKNLMRQFQTEFDGEMIDIEAHITYSKHKQSIHFGYSVKLKKVIVGHCGEHLDNYSTRKVK
ncbi:MAG: hypothetical protein NC079_03395 [Clostridium sp.]|nr:hypothetical protein [Acetatifactor muris]MCM1526214.1 hypothetical protein [Bacteroides sp.]MCM1562638.1 hypothetical protein [Clostridium sp.]